MSDPAVRFVAHIFVDVAFVVDAFVAKSEEKMLCAVHVFAVPNISRKSCDIVLPPNFVMTKHGVALHTVDGVSVAIDPGSKSRAPDPPNDVDDAASSVVASSPHPRVVSEAFAHPVDPT